MHNQMQLYFMNITRELDIWHFVVLDWVDGMWWSYISKSDNAADKTMKKKCFIDTLA